MCARIKALHPDILDRQPKGLYRQQLAGPDLREALFDYLPTLTGVAQLLALLARQGAQ